MRKLLVLLGAGLLMAATPPPRNPATQAAGLDWLRARLDVCEATARPGNDGPAVAAIIRAGGGNPASHPEWCGFTQAANQKAYGLPIPAGGMQGAARCWFTDANGKHLLPRTCYAAGQRGVLDSLRPGDLAGFAWHPNPVIHHVTRLAEVVPPLRKGRPPRGFWCIGGNEGRYPNAGMHCTYYAAASITAASRWDYK